MDENLMALNEIAVRGNLGILEYSRTCQAAISGCAAGVLGLSPTLGFLFYFIAAIVQSLFWWLKADYQWSRFFLQNSSLSHGMFGGLLTYMLTWTFLYGMVHVY